MEKISFTLTTEFIELFKLLKVTGLCESGGMAKHAISQSEVKVDGQVETLDIHARVLAARLSRAQPYADCCGGLHGPNCSTVAAPPRWA